MFQRGPDKCFSWVIGCFLCGLGVSPEVHGTEERLAMVLRAVTIGVSVLDLFFIGLVAKPSGCKGV